MKTENKKYKFLYVYICTGVYKKMFDGFVKSLNDFCYEDDVIHEVKLLTDDVNFEYQSYETDKIKIHPYYITHLPWPLITLLKFHYINNFVDYDCDAIFYCNGNFRFHSIAQMDKKLLTNGKLKCINVSNTHGYGGWQEFNKYKPSLLHSGGTFIWGPPKAFKDICEFIIRDTDVRLLNNEILPKHDEDEINIYTKYIDDNFENQQVFEILDFHDWGRVDYALHQNGAFKNNYYNKGYSRPTLVLDLEKIKFK